MINFGQIDVEIQQQEDDPNEGREGSRHLTSYNSRISLFGKNTGSAIPNIKGRYD